MNWWQGIAQLVLLTGLTGTAGLLASALAAGSEAEGRERLERARRLMPVPVLLWLALVAVVHGLRPGVLLSAAVWTGGWVLFSWLARHAEVRSAVGLLAMWTLCGAGLALTADLSPGLRRTWDLDGAAGAAALVLAVSAVGYVGLRAPHRLAALGGPPGIRAALLFGVIAFIAGITPPLKNGCWAWAFFAFILGTAAAAARTVRQARVAGNLYQWGERWWRPLVLAVAPVVILVLPFWKEPDFSPSVVLGTVLLSTFWFVRERRAAVALFAFTLVLVGFCYSLRVPHRLISRVHDVVLPTQGLTDQQLQALWCNARGGLWGRGVGHYLVFGGACACRAREQGTKPHPALLQLPVTDSIWGIATETVGVAGSVTLLGLAGLVAAWLWGTAASASGPWRRCWFVSVFTAWTLCHVLTFGWTVARWPIMGLAVPLMSGGHYNWVCWVGLLALSTGLAIAREDLEIDPMPAGARRGLPEADGRGQLWVPASAALLVAWMLIGLFRHGLFLRDETLQLLYIDRRSEARAREAVLSGKVIVGPDGMLQVNEERARSADSDTPPQQLAVWIRRGALRAVGKRVEVVSPAFRIQEPSLGEVLRLTGRR